MSSSIVEMGASLSTEEKVVGRVSSLIGEPGASSFGFEEGMGAPFCRFEEGGLSVILLGGVTKSRFLRTNHLAVI